MVGLRSFDGGVAVGWRGWASLMVLWLAALVWPAPAHAERLSHGVAGWAVSAEPLTLPVAVPSMRASQAANPEAAVTDDASRPWGTGHDDSQDVPCDLPLVAPAPALVAVNQRSHGPLPRGLASPAPRSLLRPPDA